MPTAPRIPWRRPCSPCLQAKWGARPKPAGEDAVEPPWDAGRREGGMGPPAREAAGAEPSRSTCWKQCESPGETGRATRQTLARNRMPAALSH